jgi:hypothetical protein
VHFLDPGHPTFEDVNFSLITALNAQKDKMPKVFGGNEAGINWFTFILKTPLLRMWSKARRAKIAKNREAVHATDKLPMHRQQQLWDAFPSSSEHIPGKLSLCLELAILIRNNDATELCIH